MDVIYELKPYIFGLLVVLGGTMVLLFSVIARDLFSVFLWLFIKRFLSTIAPAPAPAPPVVDTDDDDDDDEISEITDADSDDEITDLIRNIINRRRLNLLEIMSHLFWKQAITETVRGFIWAILPEEFLPILKAYERRMDPYSHCRKTPFVFKYLLNNPSETAADFAETFTRFVLADLGFHHLSPHHNNPNYNYPVYYDSRVYLFKKTLSKSCFARRLVDLYNSIDWNDIDSNHVPRQTRFTEFEMMILRRLYFCPEDNEWVEPLNNWFNWYIKTIHERIFPFQDYQVFEVTVKFLFFSFLHDIAAPYISLLALFGITVY